MTKTSPPPLKYPTVPQINVGHRHTKQILIVVLHGKNLKHRKNLYLIKIFLHHTITLLKIPNSARLME